MIRPLTLLAMLLVAGPAAAQADLFGVVADAESAGPIVGAAVVLTDSAGTVRGRGAGTEGQFVFRGLLSGRYVLRVTALGYAPLVDTLALADGERRDLAVSLTPRTAALGAVEVEAIEGAAVREPGLTRLRPADLAALPTLDPGGDLASGILAQPGVSTLGDRGGQLSVRGGTPTQNLVLVDGIPLFQPFHLLGGYSALPAGVVRSADVYAGGWPARFGGRIASVVDVTGRTGHKRRVGGAVTASPVLLGAEVELPIVPGDMSFLGSVRQSVVEQSGEALGIALPYRFSDAYGKLHARLDATSTLQGTVLFADDEGDLGINGNRITTRTEAAGGQFFSISSAFAAAIDVSAYWSRFTTTFDPIGAPFREASAETFGGRFGYVYYVGPHTVRTGIQASSYLFQYSFQPNAETGQNTSEGSIFVDADLDLGAGVRLEPGLRVQTFPAQARTTSVEPRLLMSWATGPSLFRAAAGVYRQEIVGLQDQRDVGDVFTAWTTTQTAFPVPTAVHRLVGWEGGFGPVRLGVEGYAKALSGQTILLDGRLLSTNGNARGVEVTAALRRPGLRLDARYGAQSLTYRDAERTYRPPFHRPHRLSVDGRVERGPFALAAAFQLTSGRPISEVAGAYLDLTEAIARGIPIEAASGPGVVLFAPEPYGGRTPPYARLDVSAEWAVRIPGARAVVQAAVLNATDRANVFYYDALRAEPVNQLPLLPTLGLRVEVE
ncbi:carboxypeptidase regulatory-like domain-containing protein [Rubrivirga sp. SAORIC476]|uniref:TonB-dependent receptor n=1 Tax=Rubrivirga sp. SAORIC476 TaxID=1961794 RepID=UPI00117AD5C8|nr:carboxypeptidase regulatory-like domain-containing protein [Rubrivirga sp. SAORIC476]